MSLAYLFLQTTRSTTAITANRKARSKAIRSALMSAGSVHPEYAGVGFDERLMKNEAAEIMEPFFCTGTLPTANALLIAWAGQFPYSADSTQRAMANIAPMVKEFLYVLASEAASIPVLDAPAATYTGTNQSQVIHPNTNYAGAS